MPQGVAAVARASTFLKDEKEVRCLSADFATTLGELPENLQVRSQLRGRFDLIHFFTASRKELEANFPKLRDRLERSGSLWISWPKKASGMASEIAEGDVRTIGLSHGLVDVKVCAVDETWSGLKFVYRVVDR